MRPWMFVALPLGALFLPTCATVGCPSGAASCEIPSPCEGVQFTCDVEAAVTARRWTAEDVPPGAQAALVAEGDVVLDNGIVTVVIEAIDHPHYLAPAGGGIVDMYTSGGDDDAMRLLTQGAGLLPDDAAHYTSLEIVEEGGEVAAVQVAGTLDGYPDIRIATRYELRPCDAGVRIRTEMVNDSPHTRSLALLDAWYFGDRQQLPFIPTEGGGFDYPSFGLSDVDQAFRTTPFFAVGARMPPSVSYGAASCDIEELAGFHSVSVSAIGPPRRALLPGDFVVWERFVSLGDSASTSSAIAPLLELRKQLWGASWVTVSGRVEVEGGDLTDMGTLHRAQVILSAGQPGAPPEELVPYAHVVPEADGTFSAAVPAGQPYVVKVEAFGQQVAETTLEVNDTDADVGTLSIPQVGALTLRGTIDGTPDWLLAFVTPSVAEDVDPLMGQFLGQFDACAPMLGHPYGDSPACDRVLFEGETTVLVPPGTYDIRAVAGPFSTLGEVQSVQVTAGGVAEVDLSLEMLPLQPEGTMSADFHVHGAASFDAMFSAETRLHAVAASRIDLVATTEHDGLYDYRSLADTLGLSDRVAVLDGTESTGHVLWDVFEDSSFPKVVGHWNIWPIPYDDHDPYRGAPWDELVLPGALFDRAVAQGFDRATGVIQLNHPWGGFSFGRDFGWAETLGLDLTKPLPMDAYDGSGQSMFTHTPVGASFANSDYHVQEVMNGSNNHVYLAYRQIWHYLLNQGLPRGGTANSDSHSLTDNVLGFPRNLVWTDATVADFAASSTTATATFHEAVRDGRMSGTNGPVVEVSTVDEGGATRGPSLTPFSPGNGAELVLKVSAAPWVPVEEVRAVVNGEVVRTWAADDLARPADDGDVSALVRLDTSVSLAELLPASGDAWLVIEAGAALPLWGDLNCDGVPDTTDNDASGTVDWRDVDGLEEAPTDACLDTTGPFEERETPERGAEGYAFSVVVPGGLPMSFTNPLLLDRDGDGFEGVAP